ncbi:MAG TPA: hypothetical protein VI316_00770 [Candidatus Dormibacteraeota bacterium]
MRRRRPALAFALFLTPMVLMGCGGASTASSPTASRTASPPPPSASPAPGPRRIDVTATGLGSYLETTVPVAILRSASVGEVAIQVSVHLRVATPAGKETASADAGVSAIPPGASVVVTARVRGALRGNVVTAAVTVGGWVATSAAPPASLAVSAGPPSCPGCARGGSGTLLVTVSGTTQGTLLQVGAACRDAAGHIVGGGSALHPGGPSPVAVTVPIILSAPAAHCADVSVTPGSF